MQKYEKGQRQKSNKYWGSKVKIASVVSRTYDDFLPLACVTDEAGEAKQPQKAQELKRDEGEDVSKIGFCHHYWHCDMICAFCATMRP